MNIIVIVVNTAPSEGTTPYCGSRKANLYWVFVGIRIRIGIVYPYPYPYSLMHSRPPCGSSKASPARGSFLTPQQWDFGEAGYTPPEATGGHRNRYPHALALI